MRIDLNADLAEGAPFDEHLLRIVSTANVCCGAHAGSPDLSRRIADQARELGVRVAAHPGYPDPGFGRIGRTTLDGLPEGWLEEQLRVFAYDAIKPHGGLYHDLAAGRHGELGPFFAGVPFLGLEGHRGFGSALILEGFAERGYSYDGSLIPRGHPGALIEEPEAAARQALELAPRMGTICIHGDSPNAVAIARAVRHALEAAGYEIGP